MSKSDQNKNSIINLFYKRQWYQPGWAQGNQNCLHLTHAKVCQIIVGIKERTDLQLDPSNCTICNSVPMALVSATPGSA